MCKQRLLLSGTQQGSSLQLYFAAGYEPLVRMLLEPRPWKIAVYARIVPTDVYSLALAACYNCFNGDAQARTSRR
jgi:hypothetical protein